jgi:hypothetical protein
MAAGPGRTLVCSAAAWTLLSSPHALALSLHTGGRSLDPPDNQSTQSRRFCAPALPACTLIHLG